MAKNRKNAEVLKSLSGLKYLSSRYFISRAQLEEGDTVQSFWKSVEGKNGKKTERNLKNKE